uniref:Uncharacterized protein n=1 Tax=Parascaris univalens TaxID=6257 RepID=A0A915BAX0_PARUN
MSAVFSETPCVRVEDIPAEVHSLPSQDPTNEESLEMKEVTDATKDNSAKSCNVSSNNKVHLRPFRFRKISSAKRARQKTRRRLFFRTYFCM